MVCSSLTHSALGKAVNCPKGEIVNNQKIMDKIEYLQGALSRGAITINAPCGPEPIIELLGGIHARAAINETRGRFPQVAGELQKVEELIEMLQTN